MIIALYIFSSLLVVSFTAILITVFYCGIVLKFRPEKPAKKKKNLV